MASPSTTMRDDRERDVWSGLGDFGASATTALPPPRQTALRSIDLCSLAASATWVERRRCYREDRRSTSPTSDRKASRTTVGVAGAPFGDRWKSLSRRSRRPVEVEAKRTDSARRPFPWSRRGRVQGRDQEKYWSGRRDLNPRPQRPERCALPSCATSRRQEPVTARHRLVWSS